MVAGTRRTDAAAAVVPTMELPEVSIVAAPEAAPRPTLEATIAAATTMPPGMQSVGRGAVNRPQDVEFVRRMLAAQFPENAAIQQPFASPMSAAQRTALTNAIVAFQDRESVGQRNGHGDGVISVGSSGTTKPTMTRLRTLTTEAVSASYAAETARLAHESTHANESGRAPTGPAAPRGGSAASTASAPSRSTAEKIFLDFPAAQRAGNVWSEEILGGGEDIAQGWESNNIGQMLQGVGSAAGGAVRMVGSAVSYIPGLLGNLATRASDIMWDRTPDSPDNISVANLWHKGGINILWAILLAIPTIALKVVAMALNATAFFVDLVFKFFGETIIEGLISWIGEAIGGNDENESDIRAGVREAEEKAARTAATVERRREQELERVRGQAQEGRNAEIRAAERELSSSRGTLANNQRMIAAITAIPEAQRTPFQVSQMTTLPMQNAALVATIAQQEQALANLRAAPLPTPAAPAATGNGATTPPLATAPNPA